MNSMSLEEQANAMFRIQRALALGLVEPALADLREAEATGSSPDTIVPLLVDLYCQLGMADQAIPLMGNIGNKGMESTSGISSYRQGLVQALLGDYLGAYAGWANESIPVAELDEVRNGLIAGKMWVSGEFGPATRSFLDLPEQGRMVASRAFELGILHLEAGQPKLAADAFTKALKRGMDLDFAPLAKYYLEKLGQPFVEPASTESKPDAPTVPDPSDKKPEAVPATDSSGAKSVKPGPAEEKPAGGQAKKEATPTQTGSQTNAAQKPE
jgi:tetratricopeptide (TPR) repeat protein